MPRTKAVQPDTDIAEFQKAAQAAKEVVVENLNTENIQVVKPVHLKENEVLLPNGKILTIKPTRIKYLKNGWFQVYRLVENMGLVKLLQFSDGEELLKNYFKAITDDHSELLEEIYDDLSLEDISNIIQVSKRINGIKDEDFNLAPMEG